MDLLSEFSQLVKFLKEQVCICGGSVAEWLERRIGNLWWPMGAIAKKNNCLSIFIVYFSFLYIFFVLIDLIC